MRRPQGLLPLKNSDFLFYERTKQRLVCSQRVESWCGARRGFCRTQHSDFEFSEHAKRQLFVVSTCNTVAQSLHEFLFCTPNVPFYFLVHNGEIVVESTCNISLESLLEGSSELKYCACTQNQAARNSAVDLPDPADPLKVVAKRGFDPTFTRAWARMTCLLASSLK